MNTGAQATPALYPRQKSGSYSGAKWPGINSQPQPYQRIAVSPHRTAGGAREDPHEAPLPTETADNEHSDIFTQDLNTRTRSVKRLHSQCPHGGGGQWSDTQTPAATIHGSGPGSKAAPGQGESSVSIF